MYEWLAFALVWVALWLLFYHERPLLRRQMLWVSVFTALTGLTEPLFVPAYWNPPSLFNLTATIHLDLESIIFGFGVGGVASVLYEAALNVGHRQLELAEQKEKRWVHLASLLSMPVVFLVLILFSGWNPIYCVTVALFVGATAAVACRPDLARNTLLGGVLFAGLYFFFFAFANAMFPNFLDAWNMSALSGVLVLSVPLEEVVYALAFGMMWSGVFEHIRHYVLH